MDAYRESIEELNSLPELRFKMRHILRKYGAIQIIAPLLWNEPQETTTDQTIEKTWEK